MTSNTHGFLWRCLNVTRWWKRGFFSLGYSLARRVSTASSKPPPLCVCGTGQSALTSKTNFAPLFGAFVQLWPQSPPYRTSALKLASCLITASHVFANLSFERTLCLRWWTVNRGSSCCCHWALSLKKKMLQNGCADQSVFTLILAVQKSNMEPTVCRRDTSFHKRGEHWWSIRGDECEGHPPRMIFKTSHDWAEAPAYLVKWRPFLWADACAIRNWICLNSHNLK